MSNQSTLQSANSSNIQPITDMELIAESSCYGQFITHGSGYACSRTDLKLTYELMITEDDFYDTKERNFTCTLQLQMLAIKS
jgi:hypothetical protein